MPEMIYIKEICPGSFFHLSAKKESFALRDYSKPGTYTLVAKDSPTRQTVNIRAEAEKPGNYLIKVAREEKGIDDYAFWHEQPNIKHTPLHKLICV